MDKDLKIGDNIILSSGLKYEITKVFDCGYYDIKALQPQFEWLPDYYPVYLSVKLTDYAIFH